jgi:hypothetical protein
MLVANETTNPDFEVLKPQKEPAGQMVLLGMHRISGLPDNPAFFDIRFQAGYRI